MKKIFDLSTHIRLYTRQFLMGKNSSLFEFLLLPQSSLNTFFECLYQGGGASTRQDMGCVNIEQSIK